MYLHSATVNQMNNQELQRLLRIQNSQNECMEEQICMLNEILKLQSRIMSIVGELEDKRLLTSDFKCELVRCYDETANRYAKDTR